MSLSLILNREPTLLMRVTFGDLYTSEDGVVKWECHTLEDAVREVPNTPVAEWKIKGVTAIPASTYKLGLIDSPHFGPDTLHILGVPGFELIYLHGGNKPEDTEGCVLVGAQRTGAAIYDCAKALDALKAKVVPRLKAGEVVTITINNHISLENSHGV